ncbi:gluconokinase [Cohnella silvisoli]|uniref:Gluconokinase n=1 Tax=Cohnella silvisoli TaxID=2873699 RepID=A0ABV1L3L6_9BACL|nr:gluconokinase [Cohnella silvisoli]MCD9026163.1 gluconokinase [Cohnella silvisoli]
MNGSKTQSVCVIAVDIGTTSTKALLVRRDGTVRASHNVPYPLETPAPDRAEQNPETIFQAVVEGIRTVASQLRHGEESLACVSFSSAMHSVIAVDADFNPLTPSITWADNRGAELAEAFRETEKGIGIYRRTGTPIHPMSPLVKIMWLQRFQPEIVKAACCFIGIKEYVLGRLFHRTVMDESIASATGLYASEQGDWDEEALAAAGISRIKLPELVPVTFRLQGLDPADAAMLGVESHTPFVVGASDGVLANLGVGANGEGICACTIGTSGAVRTVWKRPRTDPKGRLFCYKLLEDYWVGGGAINNGGIALQWLTEQLAGNEGLADESRAEALENAAALAKTVAPGAEGLLFLPFLAGERAPWYNANARGVFFGLSLYHERKHLCRSVFEGVLYRIRSVFEAMVETGGGIGTIRASGGFAKSPFWCQMLADMTNTKVSVSDSVESSGIGAAMIGLLATGEIGSLDEVRDWTAASREYEPRETEYKIYSRYYSLYMNVYYGLKQPFADLAALRKEMLQEAEGEK